MNEVWRYNKIIAYIDDATRTIYKAVQRKHFFRIFQGWGIDKSVIYMRPDDYSVVIDERGKKQTIRYTTNVKTYKEHGIEYETEGYGGQLVLSVVYFNTEEI